MNEIQAIAPVDYLIIGHITQDITPNGLVLGGTASYAGLTARSFGIRVGIVTSCRLDLDLQLTGWDHDHSKTLRSNFHF